MAVEFRSNLDVILFILSPPNELSRTDHGLEHSMENK
jgi:hypothetical protein